MDILIRGAVIGIVASVIGLMIKKNSPEMALLLSVSAGVVILYFALSMLSGIKVFIQELADSAGLSPAILSPVLKNIGIAIAGKLTSDFCRDAGQAASAGAVELIAAAAAIYVSIPLMRTVLHMLQSFM
jgi:stage III sporulation protein AD